MVWVIFDEPFRFVPEAKRAVTLRYNAGTEYNVTRECVEKAEAKGVSFRKLNKGFQYGNISENEGPRQAEGKSAPDAEDGSTPDDGSGEGERSSTEERGPI